MAITLTYDFTANTLARAAHVQANFDSLETKALDKTGDTMTGNLLFTDATYDIGATGATRPRDLHLSRNLIVAGASTITGNSTYLGNLAITGTLTAGNFNGGKPFVVYTPAHNNPPGSAYATPDTRNNRPCLDFDGATDEEAVFPGVLPLAYNSGGLTADIYVAFTSATSGSVRFQAAIERADLSGLDFDSDSFTSFQSAGGTAPGTSGQIIKVSVAFTSGSQMGSLVAGESFRLKVRRDADGTSGTDDITTDAEVYRVVLRET